MTKYQGIGWFSSDATNTEIVPFSRIVEVYANDKNGAYNKVADALEAIRLSFGEKTYILNWYVKKLK